MKEFRSLLYESPAPHVARIASTALSARFDK